ncbi:hypothetical protein AGMMS49545_22750 [Betaproteobacteria bacterium]|nr:hypothetical protein AGMMS49545_22750 [Betaproteobacteria bacterium]GHU48196.1 hypothetical protein AGMMS50289_24500 [Betaproteobacteria bacterium]
MANELDELTGVTNPQGRDIAVIDRQLPVTVGGGSLLFEIALWLLGILPGLIFLFMKIGAKNYFQQIQQKLQRDASEIDNYLEQRVQILGNAAGLLEKAITLDQDVMKSVAALRSGNYSQHRAHDDSTRNVTAQTADVLTRGINLAFEAYPDLKAHAAIADALQQNAYLQKEITAARAVYNDTVALWNQSLFQWPTRQIVAARAGYTTRIPFTASAEVKQTARSKFF